MSKNSKVMEGQTIVSKVSMQDYIVEGGLYLVSKVHYAPGTTEVSGITVFDDYLKEWLLFQDDYTIAPVSFNPNQIVSPTNLKDLLKENKALKRELQKSQHMNSMLTRTLKNTRGKLKRCENRC